MKKQNGENSWQQFDVTFYSYRSDAENFIEYLKDVMQKVVTEVEETEEGQFKLTLFDGSPVFARVHSDAQYVKSQISGMAGYFSQAPVANQEVKSAAITQIQLFKYIASVMALHANE